jgi:outer membrane immunogenic protein
VGRTLQPEIKKPIETDPQISAFTWAGPYAGFGVGLARSKWTFLSPVPPGGAGATDDSVNLAGQVGYNWLFGRLLVGGEVDFSIQHVEGSENVNSLDAAFSAGSNWLATVRGRVGTEIGIPYIAERSLIYVTAGPAFSRITSSYCLNASVQCYVGLQRNIGGGWISQGAQRFGTALGGGIELPLANMIAVKFEYFYVNFGNIHFTSGTIPTDFSFSEQILRTGMNFKLN